MSDDRSSLAFNIAYTNVGETCAEAGCDGCNAVHRRLTGDATLTVSGTIATVREIAAQIIPGWPTPEPRPAVPIEEPTLTAAELDAMFVGAAIYAGGFGDHERTVRTLWRRLHSGRWMPEHSGEVRIDGKPGVTAGWLANNRRPRLNN